MPRISKRAVSYTATAEKLLDLASGEIEALHTEIEEVCDNMSAADVEHLPRFEILDQDRENLEESHSYLLEAIDACDDMVGKIEISYTQDERANGWSSRGRRRDNAVSMMAALIEALGGEELEEAKSEVSDEEFRDRMDAVAKNVVEYVESAQPVAEDCTFPGMFI